MTEFNDALLESYAVDLLDSFTELPLTLENLIDLVPFVPTSPFFLVGFANSAITLHLTTNPLNTDTLWSSIKTVIEEGADPALFKDSLIFIVNIPGVSLSTRNEIVNIINDSDNDSLKEALNEAYNSENISGLQEALQGVNQAIFIFNAYSPYFDQIIPKFQSDPMLDGLLKAKASIEESIDKLSPNLLDSTE